MRLNPPWQGASEPPQRNSLDSYKWPRRKLIRSSRQRRFVRRPAVLDLVEDHLVGEPLDRRAVVRERRAVRTYGLQPAADERQQQANLAGCKRRSPLERDPRDRPPKGEQNVVE